MFRFTAPSTGQYAFSVTDKAASLLYLDGYLFDGTKARIAGQLVKMGASFGFAYALVQGQTYYLKADGYSGTGGYTVNIQVP
jgi:hypothetical protein